MLFLKYVAILLHFAFFLGQGTVEGKEANQSEVVKVEQTLNPATIPLPDKPLSSTNQPVPDSSAITVTPDVITSVTIPPGISTTVPTPINVTTTTPSPKKDQWEVVGKNGTVCIIAIMDIKLDLKPNLHSKDVFLTVPKEAVANGTCDKNEQSLVLSWEKNSFSMFFKANETLKKYYLSSIAVKVEADNNTVNLSGNNITMFETGLNHSYLCSYSDPLKVTYLNESGQFTFSNIKLVAFKEDNSTSFSNVYACPPDTPDVVPIVVGCALTVLVVVVLIAYLVSRRRSLARGYLSM